MKEQFHYSQDKADMINIIWLAYVIKTSRRTKHSKLPELLLRFCVVVGLVFFCNYRKYVREFILWRSQLLQSHNISQLDKRVSANCVHEIHELHFF